MGKKEDTPLVATRRRRLAQALNELDGGNRAAFCQRIGKSTTQLSDMIHGGKSFGEKVTLDLEASCGKPRGWFDVDEFVPKASDADYMSKFQLAYDSASPDARAGIEAMIDGILRRKQVPATVRETEIKLVNVHNRRIQKMKFRGKDRRKIGEDNG